MRRRHASLLSLIAAALLAAIACGASVPTKPEAAAVLSKAIESRLTRTLPLSTYCMTVRSDYSLANMSQMDLVEMFQNLNDKGPLNDAAAAGVVRVELKEFRVDPAGHSPDPSCDALHEQYKESGGPVRFAIVRTTLTPKGTAAGVELDRPIEIATRELVDVTDIRAQPGGAALVTYTWRWKTTRMAEVIGYEPDAPKKATATLRRSGAGWTVSETGVK